MLVDFSCPLTIDNLIHDSAQIVDFGLERRDKAYILNRIQYWKNFLINRQVRRIILMQHTSIDSICIFYAAAETQTTIVVLPIDRKMFLNLAVTVDLVFISKSLVDWVNASDYIDLSKLNNIFYLDETEINSRLEQCGVVQYTPDVVNLEHEFVVAHSSGTTGKPKQIIHTCQTFLKGAELSGELYSEHDSFASHGSTNHVGMVSVNVLGPLFKGATLYTVKNIKDLAFLASRKVLNKVFIYESDFSVLVAAKASEFSDMFDGCTIMTGGGILTTRFVDCAFEYGAKKVISLYGNNEAITQQFAKVFNSPQDEIVGADIGTPTRQVQYKIKNCTLWIKSPCIGKYITVDEDGFFDTNDHVLEYKGQIFYQGRQRYIINNKEIFDLDIGRCIMTSLKQDLMAVEYVTDVDVVDNLLRVNLYPRNNVANQVIIDSLDQIKENLSRLTSSDVAVYHSNILLSFDVAMTGIKPNLFSVKQYIEEQQKLTEKTQHESTLDRQ